jgi:ABC-type branched-subunit amino acid transport system permease subunit
MKIPTLFPNRRAAFTLVDSVISMALLLVVIGASCGAIKFGFNVLRLSRENARATQIMVEKTEQIRLFNWDQLTSQTNGFLPTNTFLVGYYANNLGVTYTGQVTLRPVTLPVAYSNDMREVQLTVRWQTGGLLRSRSLTTFVSRYGLQNYVF